MRKRLLPVQLDTRESAPEQSVENTRTAPGAKLSHKACLLMTRQLATLIDAAVPVDEALAMIAAQQEQPAARR
ncbi:MAG TPA: hypothetical protein PLN53_12150, partial [Terricaulis sp.]|nr:hypothetical protein [Terricaulis sp.]